MATLAVIPADFTGCGYYRMLVPYREAGRLGHEVYWGWEGDKIYLHQLDHVDVACFQRDPTDLQCQLAGMMKQGFGKKIVLEIDDNLHDMPLANPTSGHFGKGKPGTIRVDRMLRFADAVMVSTPRLKEAYTSICRDLGVKTPNIHVGYNALADDQFARISGPINAERKDPRVFTIGWAGSAAHVDDMFSVLRPLFEFMRKHNDVRLVVAGADYTVGLPLDIRVKSRFAGMTKQDETMNRYDDSTLPSVRYYDLMKGMNMDVAIAPLVPTLFNSTKSYLKLIEYGAIGVPVIASPRPPYRQYVNECSDTPALLADGDREWLRALETLYASKEKRLALATANMEYVRTRHLASQRVHAWEGMLDSLNVRVPA